MIESGSKICVQQLPGNRKFHVHGDDFVLGTFEVC